MEAASASETSVNDNQTTRCNNPKDIYLQIQGRCAYNIKALSQTYRTQNCGWFSVLLPSRSVVPSPIVQYLSPVSWPVVRQCSPIGYIAYFFKKHETRGFKMALLFLPGYLAVSRLYYSLWALGSGSDHELMHLTGGLVVYHNLSSRQLPVHYFQAHRALGLI
jgi:hypothetical protein